MKAAQTQLILTLDGDGQNDPADIPKLVHQWETHSSEGPPLLVAGIRAQRRDSFLRRLSSRIANAVRAGILKDGTPDTGCSLKLFSRENFLSFPFFDHMHRFIPALHVRAGGEIILVPVNHRPRQKGVSKYGVSNRLWVGLVDLFGVLWLSRRNKNPVIEYEE